MTPDNVLKAAYSIRQLDEVGTWFPTKPELVYLTLSSADPYGPVRDNNRMFLRLDKDEQNAVVTALLSLHEKRLAAAGVTVEEPPLEGCPVSKDAVHKQGIGD